MRSTIVIIVTHVRDYLLKFLKYHYATRIYVDKFSCSFVNKMPSSPAVNWIFLRKLVVAFVTASTCATILCYYNIFAQASN